MPLIKVYSKVCPRTLASKLTRDELASKVFDQKESETEMQCSTSDPHTPEPEFVNPGINSYVAWQAGTIILIIVRPSSAGIFEQSM